MIKVKDLSFSYPNKDIFKDVNFEIKYGDFVGIVGENGSGKSTLLDLLLGMKKKNKGTIELMGKNIEKFNDYNKIGVVFQSGLNKSKGFPANVLEVVMSKSNKMNKNAKKLAMESLKHLDIQDLAKERISKLSGGQLQRVYLARELLYDPKILFLDEPQTGLDKESQRLLLNTLTHLNEVHKMTIVMITHSKQDESSLDYKLRVHQRKVIREEIDA